MTDKELKDKIDFTYDVHKQRLERQIEDLSSIDTKASILLVTIGVLFAGYLQLFNQYKGFANYKILVIIEFICFIMAGFFTFRAFILHKKEKWRNDPDPNGVVGLIGNNPQKDMNWIKSRIILNKEEAIKHNDKLVRKKYNFFIYAEWTIGIEIILLLIHFICVLYTINTIVVYLK